VARDRKRAKQRQQRRARKDPASPGVGPEPTQPLHENVPESVEHSSGEVQEFDAKLIAGAGGEVADPAAPSTRDEVEASEDPEVAGTTAPARRERPSGNRVAAFLRASWAELQRVQWPDRRQVAQATGVVLGFVAIAGAYLGLADVVAQKVVDTIL